MLGPIPSHRRLSSSKSANLYHRLTHPSGSWRAHSDPRGASDHGIAAHRLLGIHNSIRRQVQTVSPNTEEQKAPLIAEAAAMDDEFARQIDMVLARSIIDRDRAIH